MEKLENKYYIFPQVEVDFEDFDHEGYILDIGGGGEAVIGQLKGKDVIAIDINKKELEKAPHGPLKLVMDARELQFLDESFSTVTAFFALMYIWKREDQKKIIKEAWRVLNPNGILHLWEVDLSERPQTDKDIYLVHLFYRIGDQITETGYGQRWPEQPRGQDYYLSMAKEVGFREARIEKNKNTFYAKLIKD
jgi:ubiquinone/menaquinone biosynthesis C-methylase UbiE